MASREITDRRGAVWVIWEVQPETIERRMAEDPFLKPAVERRRVRQFRSRISNPAMARGWLVFETRAEKRRLAPVPQGWELLPDAELLTLLDQAQVVGNPRRLIE